MILTEAAIVAGNSLSQIATHTCVRPSTGQQQPRGYAKSPRPHALSRDSERTRGLLHPVHTSSRPCQRTGTAQPPRRKHICDAALEHHSSKQEEFCWTCVWSTFLLFPPHPLAPGAALTMFPSCTVVGRGAYLREGDPVRTPICIQCALLSQHPARTLFASSAHSWVSGKGFWEGKGFRVFRVQGLGVQGFRV